jgi:hypothetical protein
LLRAPGAKALALLWGPLVSLAVVVTGNHYVFDIAAGLVAPRSATPSRGRFVEAGAEAYSFTFG